jgi:hypothetical protein
VKDQVLFVPTKKSQNAYGHYMDADESACSAGFAASQESLTLTLHHHMQRFQAIHLAKQSYPWFGLVTR